MKQILIALAITTTCYSQFEDSLSISLANYVSQQDSSEGWSLYPLTTFPYLKTRPHPWTMGCSQKYARDIIVRGSVCNLENREFWVGTIFRDSTGAIYLASKYTIKRSMWYKEYEYVLFTNIYNEVLRVVHRKTGQPKYEDYPW